MRPPAVYMRVPANPCHILPVCDFLVTRLGFLALVAFFGALALDALRAALGAFGLAARRVALRALRAAFLGAFALEARRTPALTAIFEG